jgi:hypothetical protein
MAEELLKVVQDALKVPNLIVEIYGDLARPGVKQAGKALETIIGLGNTVLWPITLMNERASIYLQKNLEKYREKMESVPEDKVIGVAPEIGVPIAEKLSYVADEHLVDMYVKLLNTASNQDTVGDAHPSFINVINNLSPDEACLLEYFDTKDVMPFVIAKATNQIDKTYNTISGYIVPNDALTCINFQQNIDAYLDNLVGLGLLELRDDKSLANDALYEPLRIRHKDELENLISHNYGNEKRKLAFTKGAVKRTKFGLKFIKACHSN